MVLARRLNSDAESRKSSSPSSKAATSLNTSPDSPAIPLAFMSPGSTSSTASRSSPGSLTYLRPLSSSQSVSKPVFIPQAKGLPSDCCLHTVLAILTLVTGWVLLLFSRLSYFHRAVRRFIADYGEYCHLRMCAGGSCLISPFLPGMPIAVIGASGVAYWGRFHKVRTFFRCLPLELDNILTLGCFTRPSTSRRLVSPSSTRSSRRTAARGLCLFGSLRASTSASPCPLASSSLS